VKAIASFRQTNTEPALRDTLPPCVLLIIKNVTNPQSFAFFVPEPRRTVPLVEFSSLLQIAAVRI